MMNRRELLKQMAWVTAGSFMFGDALAMDVKNKKVGVQLYTLRNAIGKDPKGTLKKVAELGYAEVESFGYNGKFFGMSATEYKTVLSDLGLTAPSGHYMYGNFGNKKIPGTVSMDGRKPLKTQQHSDSNTWSSLT